MYQRELHRADGLTEEQVFAIKNYLKEFREDVSPFNVNISRIDPIETLDGFGLDLIIEGEDPERINLIAVSLCRKYNLRFSNPTHCNS